MIVRNITLLSALVLSFGSAFAGSGENGGAMVITDTMIFSFLVLLAVVLLFIIYAQVGAMKALLENKDMWNKKSGSGAEKAGVLIFALFLGQSAFAQTAAGEPLIRMTDEMYWMMIGLNTFLLGIIITMHFTIKNFVRSMRGEAEEEVDALAQISASLTDAVPIEEEATIMLDHNYDGIRELDNNLPPWWKYGFYFTIVFGIIYLIYYHIGGGALQMEEYQQQMAEGEAIKAAYMAEQANLVDENNLEVLTEGARLEAGKKVYIDLCKVCHGEYGEGIVGPNLTDQYWKHGGGIAEIYQTIKVGVPDKGMISWESQLSPGQMHEVSSYILTLQGTSPPNGKAPEGDLWEGGSDAPVEEEAEPAEEETEEEASADNENA